MWKTDNISINIIYLFLIMKFFQLEQKSLTKFHNTGKKLLKVHCLFERKKKLIPFVTIVSTQITLIPFYPKERQGKIKKSKIQL